MTLAKDHTLAEVSAAIGMSKRWIRDQVKNGAPCQKYGNRIRFTDDQVEALKARFRSVPILPTQITTTRRGRRAS